MRPPAPLPPKLIGRIFTRAEAAALGVPDRRLRARDLERVARATYRHRDLQRMPEPGLDVPDIDLKATVLPDRDFLRALCERAGAVRISHVTATRLYGLQLPRRLSNHRLLHLIGRSSTHQGREDPRIVIHRTSAGPDCTHLIGRVPVSSPQEVFVEMARYLSVSELVMLGDQLVRTPHAGLEERTRAWCTIEDIQQAAHSGKGKRGIARAREALDQVRVGADSPPETYMRLALVEAGLPEPELQIRLDPRDPYSPVGDAGYRDRKIVLQYEGEHHFTAEQQARDQRRNAAFERAVWTVILVNRVDLREGFRSVIARLRCLLAD